MFAFYYSIGQSRSKSGRLEFYINYENRGRAIKTVYVSNKIEARNLCKMENAKPWNF